MKAKDHDDYAAMELGKGVIFGESGSGGRIAEIKNINLNQVIVKTPRAEAHTVVRICRLRQ